LARIDEQYGAWLCGSCLGVVGMALHHKICHALGGVFDLPHAEMHPVLLPHVAAFNAVAAPRRSGVRLVARTPAKACTNSAGVLAFPDPCRNAGRRY
jgi:maleylacetate reductase